MNFNWLLLFANAFITFSLSIGTYYLVHIDHSNLGSVIVDRNRVLISFDFEKLLLVEALGTGDVIQIPIVVRIFYITNTPSTHPLDPPTNSSGEFSPVNIRVRRHWAYAPQLLLRSSHQVQMIPKTECTRRNWCTIVNDTVYDRLRQFVYWLLSERYARRDRWRE